MFRCHNRFGPPGQHQHDRPAFAHQLQGFERGVEEQDATHERPIGWRSAHVAAATIDDGLITPEVPLTVETRNCQYAGSGSGRKGP